MASGKLPELRPVRPALVSCRAGRPAGRSTRSTVVDQANLRLNLLLSAAVLILAAAYLLPGLSARNLSYFLPLRALKVGAILLVSFSTGYTATAFQTITDNHILTPGILGFESMYVLVQTLLVYLYGSKVALMSDHGEFLLSVGAMLLLSGLLFLLLFRGHRQDLFILLLAGTIAGSLFTAVSTFIQVLIDPNEYMQIQSRLYASFGNINVKLFGISVLLTALAGCCSLPDWRRLDVAALGPDHCVSPGVSHRHLTLRTLLLTAVMVSVSTALIGPMTFLGLLTVNVARNLLKTYKHRYRIPAAMLLGALALLASLLLVERVLAYAVTPSMLINFAGGSYFIYLMIKEGKGAKKH
ncbi:iron chelate uptake ABC transporter family permease subunit [Oscillospiraceae bacterium HV4-5-C5C]|nr:iron chelate uptake ABC transporter family permease subunit [Oscillospiraceae bacterium HV4-5-C5C]